MRQPNYFSCWSMNSVIDAPYWYITASFTEMPLRIPLSFSKIFKFIVFTNNCSLNLLWLRRNASTSKSDGCFKKDVYGIRKFLHFSFACFLCLLVTTKETVSRVNGLDCQQIIIPSNSIFQNIFSHKISSRKKNSKYFKIKRISSIFVIYYS